jgi:hypothetical protein
VKSIVFWFVTPCSWGDPDFAEKYIAPILGSQSKPGKKPAETEGGQRAVCRLLHLLFDHEDESDIFVCNIAQSPNYTVLQARRHFSF